MRNLITYLRALVETRRTSKPDSAALDNHHAEAFARDVTTGDVEVDANDTKASDETPEQVALDITPEIDLHVFQPRDIPVVVRAYLEEARARNFPVVRLVHGKGKGVQRAVVQKILADTEFVESFSDAAHYSGGWGATIAKLKTSSTRDDK